MRRVGRPAPNPATISVSTHPGATLLTVMPLGASSMATLDYRMVAPSPPRIGLERFAALARRTETSTRRPR